MMTPVISPPSRGLAVDEEADQVADRRSTPVRRPGRRLRELARDRYRPIVMTRGLTLKARSAPTAVPSPKPAPGSGRSARSAADACRIRWCARTRPPGRRSTSARRGRWRCSARTRSAGSPRPSPPGAAGRARSSCRRQRRSGPMTDWPDRSRHPDAVHVGNREAGARRRSGSAPRRRRRHRAAGSGCRRRRSRRKSSACSTVTRPDSGRSSDPGSPAGADAGRRVASHDLGAGRGRHVGGVRRRTAARRRPAAAMPDAVPR